MAYDVKYPIDFRSGGDSVKEAFSKVIEEIRTIYGILNYLVLQDLSDEQKAAVLTGKISMDRITGNLASSRISGNIEAGKVSGALSLATIDSGRVNGLADYVNNLIAESESSQAAPDKGDGITDSRMGENGYVKYGNGLIMQWGNVTVNSNDAVEVSYPMIFPTACYSLTLTPQGNAQTVLLPALASGTDYRLNRSGFSGLRYPSGSGTSNAGTGVITSTGGNKVKVYYVAIGE